MELKNLFKDKKSIVYLAVLFAIGIFMLTGTYTADISGGTPEYTQNDMSRELEKILSRVDGAGNVRVLISYSRSAERVLAYDTETENRSEGEKIDENTKSSVVYDSGRSPYVLKEYMPEAEGVIIVAQGGGDENVKKQLIKGTVALLGIDEHKIEVLKMK